MSLLSGTIPNFANGISQQAAALRLSTQGDAQVNCYSSVVDGLRKRPPLKRIDSLGSDIDPGAIVHWINRDIQERYCVILSRTGVRVFNLQGQEQTVNIESGLGYLWYETAKFDRNPLKALTVGDYTFISNPAHKVVMDQTKSQDEMAEEAIVHVKAGNYGKVYNILINGNVVAQYKTPTGASANHSPYIDTNLIARRLAWGETTNDSNTRAYFEDGVLKRPTNPGTINFHSQDTNLAANGFTAANGWTVRVVRGTIYIKRDDGTPFSIGVKDGFNGHAMKAIKGQTQDFSDLPKYCHEGFTVEITGSVSTKFDNYYVRFSKVNKTDDEATPGVWKEIPQPGIHTHFDPTTMPHVLIREADGTFTFKEQEWEERKAGDEDTVPTPSFVGQTVTDIFFFKNRLGMLAGENVIMSRHGGYFDFWRSTATALLDDDPIDVAAVTKGVSVGRTAEALQNRLIISADQHQFSLQGGDLLTPETVSITPATAYQMSNGTRPVSTGDAIFYPSLRGKYSTVREYRIVNPSTNEAVAVDVGEHVPRYLQGDIQLMAGSTHEDVLLATTRDQPGRMYVYKYYWNGDQKLQASWSHWDFPDVDRLLGYNFIGSTLYVVSLQENQVILHSMSVEPGGYDDDTNFVVHLDNRFEVTPDIFAGDFWDPNSDTTTVNVPVNMLNSEYLCVTASSSVMEPGLEIQILDKTSTQVVLKGNLHGVKLYFGIPYTSTYDLSTVYVRETGRNGSSVVVTDGRLQLIKLHFLYSNTAYFKVKVTPQGRPTYEYVTNGRILGDPENVLGEVVLGSGTADVPVLSRNERVKVQIESNSYLPFSILSAEWAGKYKKNSRRI